MIFRNKLSEFACAESGAVTVDWVVLTAMIVGMGLAVVTLIVPNLNPLVSGVEPHLQAAPLLGAQLIGAE